LENDEGRSRNSVTVRCPRAAATLSDMVWDREAFRQCNQSKLSLESFEDLSRNSVDSACLGSFCEGKCDGYFIRVIKYN
jgi:hypothetical protein